MALQLASGATLWVGTVDLVWVALSDYWAYGRVAGGALVCNLNPSLLRFIFAPVQGANQIAFLNIRPKSVTDTINPRRNE